MSSGKPPIAFFGRSQAELLNMLGLQFDIFGIMQRPEGRVPSPPTSYPVHLPGPPEQPDSRPELHKIREHIKSGDDYDQMEFEDVVSEVPGRGNQLQLPGHKAAAHSS